MPSPKPRRWRLSLVHQLALLLVGGVLLAATVLGAAVAWNLRAGFSDYLRARDEQWLDRFAEVAAAAVAERGLAAISGAPGSLDPLFAAAAPPGTTRPSPPPPPPRRSPPPRGSGGPGGPEGPEGPDWHDGMDRPPPPRGPGGFGGPREPYGAHPPGAPPDQGDRPPPGRRRPESGRIPERLSLVDPEGWPLAGRPLAPQDVLAERPIVVNGQTVARAQLARGDLATAEVDAAFLARQYRGIVLTALLLTLLAIAGAVWVGRRWLRPVRELQQAARSVAQGAFDVRLAPQGNDELADLARDINAMAASLQQLEASRRRWIAELSHEMRTPLAVLRGEVEALVDGVRPLTAAAILSLQEEVTRVTRLAEDFHQLALSDLRALPCTFASVSPAALLGAAVARSAPRAQAAGLTLVSEAAGSPPMAHWDPQRIDQLLSNLLENSLRYTDAPGRVTVHLAAGKPGDVTLRIEDSAPGVPEADHARLFEPLYRADASRSRRLGGSGLGLAICRAIVRSHGGQIEAGSSPLGGLRVVVTLPLHAEGAT